MKITVIYLLGFLLMFVLILPSCTNDIGSFPDDNQDCTEWCDDAGISAITGATNGDCVSLCNTCSNPSDSPATQAICICNFYENYIAAFSGTQNQGNASWAVLGAAIPGSGITNKGKCIKYFKSNL